MKHYINATAAPLVIAQCQLETGVVFVEQELNRNEKSAFVDYWKSQNINSISIHGELQYKRTRSTFYRVMRKIEVSLCCLCYATHLDALPFWRMAA